jgi:hypothetical protein
MSSLRSITPESCSSLIEGEEVVMQRSQERRHPQAWRCRIGWWRPSPTQHALVGIACHAKRTCSGLQKEFGMTTGIEAWLPRRRRSGRVFLSGCRRFCARCRPSPSGASLLPQLVAGGLFLASRPRRWHRPVPPLHERCAQLSATPGAHPRGQASSHCVPAPSLVRPPKVSRAAVLRGWQEAACFEQWEPIQGCFTYR